MHAAPPPSLLPPAITAEPDGSPDVLALAARAEDELRVRYPEDDCLGPEVHALDWLVARRDGRPVGLVALCALDEGVGEIKRMYVADEARRTGIARALLAAVEDAARARALRMLRLETGTRQPEALALYERCGYDEIPGYGYWADSPLSRCYEKALG